MEIMPIFVDLDGTLINCDITLFFFKKMLMKNPLLTFQIGLYYVFRNISVAKNLIGEYGYENNFPVNINLLKYLERAKNTQENCKIVLATGANYNSAKIIFNKYSIFEYLIASDRKTNCVGENKLKRINDFLREFKIQDFMYIGNNWQDLPIWQFATKIGFVLSSNKQKNKTILNTLNKLKKEIIIFEDNFQKN